MTNQKKDLPRKVLIASANPLFAGGLEKIMRQQSKPQVVLIRSVSTMDETLFDLGDC
jgi:hypothetical protein